MSCSLGRSYHLDRAMVVTVIAMRMMKTSVNDVVDMIAVRNSLMAATGPMDVPIFMLRVGDI